jgi:membrane protein DedA with SNARE-associated domain
VLLTSGWLARRGVLALLPAIAVAWVALVAGDFLLFRAGRKLGPAILDAPRVARVLTPARRALVERHFARHAVLTIVAARHASGLRLPVFAMAGASGVRSATFLLADGLSALASVPLVVGAGWWFAGHLDVLKRDLRWIELGVAVLVGVAGIAWYAMGRRRERRAAARGAEARRHETDATPPARRSGDGPPR